jgi:hypothetical protein
MLMATIIWEILGVKFFVGALNNKNLNTVKAIVPHEFAQNNHLNNEIETP